MFVISIFNIKWLYISFVRVSAKNSSGLPFYRYTVIIDIANFVSAPGAVLKNLQYIVLYISGIYF